MVQTPCFSQVGSEVVVRCVGKGFAPCESRVAGWCQLRLLVTLGGVTSLSGSPVVGGC